MCNDDCSIDIEINKCSIPSTTDQHYHIAHNHSIPSDLYLVYIAFSVFRDSYILQIEIQRSMSQQIGLLHTGQITYTEGIKD